MTNVCNSLGEVLRPDTVKLLAKSSHDVVLVSHDGDPVTSNKVLLGFYSMFLADMFNKIPSEDKCDIILPFNLHTIKSAVFFLHAGFEEKLELTEDVKYFFDCLSISLPSCVSNKDSLEGLVFNIDDLVMDTFGSKQKVLMDINRKDFEVKIDIDEDVTFQHNPLNIEDQNLQTQPKLNYI